MSLPLLLMSSLLTGCGEEEVEKQTFSNLPPFSPLINLQPSSADTTTDLRVVLVDPLPTDPDGDPVTFTYVWFNGDEQVSSTEATTDIESTISAADTTKGETWSVYVFATDGELDSAPAIQEVVIQNASPEILSFSSSPEEPTTVDDLVIDEAEISTADADGDEITFVFSWTKDGELQEDYTEAILPAAATRKVKKVSFPDKQWNSTCTPI